MKKYQGKLNRTYSTPWKNLTLHSFTLDGIDMYFRTGRGPINVKEGSFIEFEADGQNVDTATVKLVAEPQAPTEAPPVPAPSTSSSPSYWETRQKGDTDRQKAITYQAARKDAISVAELCASMTGGDLDVVLGLIDDLTMRFAADTERLHPEVPGVRPKKAKTKAKTAPIPAENQGELNLG